MSTLLRTLKNAVVALIVSAAPMPALSADPPSGPTLAIQGYDPVAYFTEARAVKGGPAFSYVWDDYVYHFTSAANRDRFAADPERYAPVFPGYCTAALSVGKSMPPDPEQWLVIGGRLYLFASHEGRQMAVERPGLVTDSRANLERLLKDPQGTPKQNRDPM